MAKDKRNILLKHVFFAAALVFLSALIRIWPLNQLESEVPWVTFYPAVIVAAIYWGLLPAIIAIVLSSLAIGVYWPLFAAAPFVDHPADYLGMGVFIGTSLMVSLVAEGMRRAKQKAADAQQWVNSIFNNSIFALVTCDEHDLIQSVNPSVERIFGYSADEIIGKKFDILLTGAAKKYKPPKAENLAIGQTGEWVECTGARKNGDLFPAEIHTSKILNNGIYYYTKSVNDISEKKRAEQERLASAERHRILLETSMDAIVTIEPPNWQYTSSNKAALQLFGLQQEGDLFALSPWELSPPFQPNGQPSLELFREAIDTALAKGTYSFNWTHQRKNGEEFPAIVMTSRFDINGRTGLQFTIRDLTEIRRSEQEYTTLLATTMDGFWEVDINGNLLDVNDAYSVMSGYTREELLTMSVPQLEDIQSPEEVDANIKKVIDTGYARFETRHRRKDKTSFHVEISSNYRNIEGGRFYVFLRDISERKASERVIIKSKEEAEQASRSKSEFLANMSHEIRTPMNAIIGLGYLAGLTKLNQKQRGYLSKIQSSAKSLLGIINDILDFSKIEAQMMELENSVFDLSDIIEQAGNLEIFNAEKKGLSIHFEIDSDIPRFLMGDPLRIRQILSNILGNAVKFTERGAIWVKVEKGIVSNGNVALHFLVKDTGIGMEKEHMRNLFRPFTQADSSITRRFGGTGLGLTICKRLIDKMGGTIKVESQLHKGSEFRFSIELGLPQQESAHPSLFLSQNGDQKGSEKMIKEASRKLKGLNVLVMEDHLINRQVVKEILEQGKIKVTTAENGKEGLELLQSKKSFDIILMDLQMPEVDGYEATRKIRETDLKTPIIAMTAHAFSEDREKCIAAGMNDHIAKPINPDILYLTLAKSVGSGAVNAGGSSVEKGSSKNGVAFPAHLPGFDIEAGLSRVLNNRALYKDIVLSFCKDNRSAVKLTSRLLRQGKLKEAKSLIHDLKGLSATVSAVDVNKAAIELEKALANLSKGGGPEKNKQRFDTLRPLILKLQQELNRSFKAAQLFEEEEPAADEPRQELEPLNLPETINELNNMLNKRDLRAGSMVNTLQCGSELEYKQEITRMSIMIEQLEFNEARKMLVHIAGKMGVPLSEEGEYEHKQ